MFRAREWAQVINDTRREEALETLRDEGVILACVFLDSTADGDYLIYFMKAESFEKAEEVAKKSRHAIDEYHQQFKRDTWEKGKRLELLFDLDRISEMTGHQRMMTA